MDKTIVCLLLCMVTAIRAQGGGDDVEMTLVGARQHIVKKGDELKLTCHFNQGLVLILTNTINWIHRRGFGQDPPETLISEQGNPNPDLSNLYNVAFSHTETTCDVELTVLAVTDDMDGYFVCRRTTKELTEEVNASVTVVSQVQDVHLIFPDESPVSKDSPQVPIERDQGHYDVRCKAVGFNPDAELQMFVGEKDVMAEASNAVLDLALSTQAGARRYTMEAVATQLHLTGMENSQMLRCKAKALLNDVLPAEEMTVEVPLVIITLDPTVTCDPNVTATIDEKFVDIKCTVDHTNIKMASFGFEVNGELIMEGDSNEHFDEVKRESRIVDGAEVSDVTLTLYQVDETHFGDFIFLDMQTESGENFREGVTLIKRDFTGAAAAVSSSGVAVLCLSGLLSLLLGL